jgi:hypothetical protein
MKSRIQSAVIAALILALLSGPAHAVSTLVFKVAVSRRAAKAPRATIYAGPQAVMTLAGHGWKSVDDAHEVARRLNALAEEGVPASRITVRREGKTRVIAAGRQTIVRIDPQIASAHRSVSQTLAKIWAENLRAQFRRPYLSARPLLVPLGETRTAAVKGNIVGGLTVRAETPVVTAVWDKAAGAVRVQALQVGRTEVVVQDERSLLRLPVRAAKYAARLSGDISASVTGNPAPAEAIARAVQAAVQARLALEPGAWASVSPWVKQAAPLAQGKSAAVPVCVSAAGEDYLPCRLRPVVNVRNETVPINSPAVLMVSNSPERLRTNGLWFEGRLQGSYSARLLYHHVNATSQQADLVVEAWNLGDQPAFVHVIAGYGGPVKDEAWAGHRAATQFLGNRESGVGWVVPIPPGLAMPVLDQRMTPGSTASGLLELRPLTQSNLSLRLYLARHQSARLARPVGSYVPSPLLGQWHYPNPRREVTATYTVGGDWAFITIGDKGALGLVEGDVLPGSYGVLYDITLELINPTAEEAPVATAIESAGGPARATLLVDGRQVESAVIRANSEAVVARHLLAPGERRRVHIETMPQAGSNYPVRLVVRPA